MKSFASALLLAVLSQWLPAAAAAQLDEEMPAEAKTYVSPEHFAVEFRVGPYQPDMGGRKDFQAFFADDSGALFALELDVVAWRVPDILYLGAGGGIGWMNFEGKTIAQNGQKSSETTSMEMFPLNLVGVLRFDALARQLSVPFIVTGKLGYQWMNWSTDSGGRSDASGWSLGLLMGAQLGLDLDFFEPSAARSMDEEWGINHSFLFFELMKFVPSQASLPIGDLTWTVGLGFMF